jgi:repressor LexA
LVARLSLTQKQQIVFEFIQRYLLEHRCAPLIREIQFGCQIASYKSAIDRLNALEHKGFIRRIPNKHRGIKLAHRAAAATPVPVPAAAQTPQPTAEASPFHEEIA